MEKIWRDGQKKIWKMPYKYGNWTSLIRIPHIAIAISQINAFFLPY
jgi:hypothetical protein